MASQSYLQSLDTATILDIIDKLRSLGIGDVLELPQIIVCGDQSSGKSAVLNAVSTLKFPSKDTLCTRFATEVIMRPGPAEPIVASIVPGGDRSSAEKRALEGFRRTDVSMDDIADLIAEATELMGIDPRNPEAKRFSNDILRFEVTGPDQPSLTLVDLPGLFQAPSKDQTDEDTESVRRLVLTYMKNKRSVILAVISAKSDFVLQSVTKHSREVDRLGLRTLGIITKPDKLDAGSEMEKMFIELAENRLAYLHRGWHVLVNRDYTTRNATQDERDRTEKEFLSSGVWARLPNNHKGVFSLRMRLTGLLRDQILEELPSLIQDAENEVKKQQEKLGTLGMPRATLEDRRRYLIQSSQTFNTLMKSCVNKPYEDKFFGDGTTAIGQQKRLRAVVQNTLAQFSEDMRERGHAKHIVSKISTTDDKSHPICVTQMEFENEVMELFKINRGRELIGTFDPLIIGELFVMQSKPWAELIHEYRQRIWVAAKITIDLVLRSSTDEVTMERLKRLLVEPSLSELGASLDNSVQKLLSTRQYQHPITYNRRLTDSIQKAKQMHGDKIFKAKIIQAVGARRETVALDTIDWLFELESPVELAELERYAAAEAIDVMRAYYEVRLKIQAFLSEGLTNEKVAKETIVDNFSSLAVEDCLLSHLPDLLSPAKIAELDDEMVTTIAMETDTAAIERSEAEERLQSSNIALEQLRSIEYMRQPLPLKLTSAPIERLEQDVPDEDITHMTSSLIGGTDISKLDQGSSDQENGNFDSREYVDLVPDSKEKKKRTKMRNTWIREQVNGEAD